VEKLKGGFLSISDIYISTGWSVWGKMLTTVDGELVMIRGVEYTAMNDELSIPDDPKGDTKVDAWGKLSGGQSPSSQSAQIPRLTARPRIQSVHLLLRRSRRL
jgi:hypothetical protein